MPFRVWLAGLVLVAGGIGSAIGQSHIDAVETGGRGVLTKCFDWLVVSPCRTYHHIRLPSRIAIGDSITLAFGSSPKKYKFSVARIALNSNHCEIFSRAGRNRHHADKINIARCGPADQER
ncbi:MAG TPA: hypothetical protein VGM07_04825 [Stellaceae bacterium]|jgi:hypothetical protein